MEVVGGGGAGLGGDGGCWFRRWCRGGEGALALFRGSSGVNSAWWRWCDAGRLEGAVISAAEEERRGVLTVVTAACAATWFIASGSSLCCDCCAVKLF